MHMMEGDIKARAGKVLMNTYGARYGITLVSGRGARVMDDEGKEYLDFVAGIAVTALGHAHPKVAEAVRDQALKLVHVSNLFFTEPQVRLAELLTAHSFADRVFFSNSGAEANEAAIKLARKYSFDHYGEGRFKVLTMEDSFHGRTLATLSATGQAKVQKGFTPLVEGFGHLPFGDLAALEKALTPEVCAVMVEPIQGESGVVAPPDGYLAELVRICRAKDVLVILDEVQTGMGRTGTLFAYEQFQTTPDILTLAKALANGLPMGAALATDKVAGVFSPGTHGTTFGGSPLVCAAALVTLETILEPGFLDQVVRVGAYFKKKLEEIAAGSGHVREVRGRGLMLALNLDFPCAEAQKELLARGFIVNCTHDTVLRFLPPLVVTEAEVDQLIPVLAEVVEEMGDQAEVHS